MGDVLARTRDQEIAVVVGPMPALDEMGEASFGGPQRAAADPHKFSPVTLGQTPAARGTVGREVASTVFDDVARHGLAQPTAEVDLGDRNAASEAW